MVDGSRTVESVIEELEEKGFEDAAEVIRRLLEREVELQDYAEEEFYRGYDNGYEAGRW